MPRRLRLEYPGAISHLMNRGDRREPIFKDDLDRQRFLLTLGRTCEKTGWQVHAWCLVQSFSSGGGDTSIQSGGGDEMVRRDLHRPLQPPAQSLRALVQRTL
jgi:hypothetical protein